MTTATERVRARSSGRTAAREQWLGHRGPELPCRPTTPGSRTSPGSSPHTVTWPSLRPDEPPCRRGGRGRPRRRGRRRRRVERVRAVRRPEDVHAWRHAGRRALGGAEGEIEHRPNVVLELGGLRALDRPVTRCCAVAAATSLTSRRRPRANISTAMHPDQIDRRRRCGRRCRCAAGRKLGVDPAGHQDLPTDAVDLGRLDHRPGSGLAGSAHHERRELEVDGDVLLDEEGHARARWPAGRPRAPRRVARPARPPCRRSRPGWP